MTVEKLGCFRFKGKLHLHIGSSSWTSTEYLQERIIVGRKLEKASFDGSYLGRGIPTNKKKEEEVPKGSKKQKLLSQ